MNPQHNVPCLNDNGFILNESRGIATYLVAKYGKDDKLYPKDAKIRAVVDQRLYFDIGTFYRAMHDIVVILKLFQAIFIRSVENQPENLNK